MADSDHERIKDHMTVRLIKKILDLSLEQQAALLRQLNDATSFDQISNERDDTRKSYKEKILFTLNSREYSGFSQDISSGGMFIKSEGTFSVGQRIVIHIPLAGKREQVKVPARIVRIQPEGIGVEFLKKME